MYLLNKTQNQEELIRLFSTRGETQLISCGQLDRWDAPLWRRELVTSVAADGPNATVLWWLGWVVKFEGRLFGRTTLLQSSADQSL